MTPKKRKLHGRNQEDKRSSAHYDAEALQSKSMNHTKRRSGTTREKERGSSYFFPTNCKRMEKERKTSTNPDRRPKPAEEKGGTHFPFRWGARERVVYSLGKGRLCREGKNEKDAGEFSFK